MIAVYTTWALGFLIGPGLLAQHPAYSRGAHVSADTTLVIRAGALVDPEPGRVILDPVVVVRDGRIVAAGPRESTAVPDEGSLRTIDLGEATLIPGLVDAHVHLTLGAGSTSPETRARATLHAGFTTVQDLGGTGEGSLPLRDAIRSGVVEGPRVVAAGPWIGVAGGTCDFDGTQPKAAEVVQRVEEVLARGADVVKLCVTGWVADAVNRPDSVEMGREELVRAVEAAHRTGRKVVAHAIGEAGARLALEAGIDALVHASLADSATMAEMARRGTYWIPTLFSLQGAPGAAEAGLGEHTARALRLGVRLAFGTDAGVIPHGQNAREFEALVGAGATAADALRAATLGAADLLGLKAEIGSLEVGKAADIVAVDGNPLEDPSALGRVLFVMKEGRIVRADAAAP